MSDVKKIGDILTLFDPTEDKYISREFQSYGIHLAEELGDYKHKALYIRLSKTVPRAILERALSFVKDAQARSKPKLFMWKMKQLKDEMNEAKKAPKRDTHDLRRVVLWISGRVQGVGFRAWTKTEATRLGVMGYAQNLGDGRVLVVAEATPKTLDALIKKCHSGPPGSRVSDVSQSWQAPTGEFDAFTIVRR